MPHGPFRASRAVWLVALVSVAFVPRAAAPTVAQTSTVCQASCTFLPAIATHGPVLVERVTLSCDGSAAPTHCLDVFGFIRNVSPAPVYDVQLDARVLLPDGRQDTLRSPSIALRGLAPGQSTPFSFSYRNGSGTPWPANSTPAITVRSYTAPPATYRPITVVSSRVVVPANSPTWYLRVELRNDTADRVGEITLAVQLESSPELPLWSEERAIPALEAGERFVYQYQMYRGVRQAVGVYGAEGVAAR